MAARHRLPQEGLLIYSCARPSAERQTASTPTLTSSGIPGEALNSSALSSAHVLDSAAIPLSGQIYKCLRLPSSHLFCLPSCAHSARIPAAWRAAAAQVGAGGRDVWGGPGRSLQDGHRLCAGGAVGQGRGARGGRAGAGPAPQPHGCQPWRLCQGRRYVQTLCRVRARAALREGMESCGGLQYLVLMPALALARPASGLPGLSAARFALRLLRPLCAARCSVLRAALLSHAVPAAPAESC